MNRLAVACIDPGSVAQRCHEPVGSGAPDAGDPLQTKTRTSQVPGVVLDVVHRAICDGGAAALMSASTEIARAWIPSGGRDPDRGPQAQQVSVGHTVRAHGRQPRVREALVPRRGRGRTARPRSRDRGCRGPRIRCRQAGGRCAASPHRPDCGIVGRSHLDRVACGMGERGEGASLGAAADDRDPRLPEAFEAIGRAAARFRDAARIPAESDRSRVRRRAAVDASTARSGSGSGSGFTRTLIAPPQGKTRSANGDPAP